MTRYRVLPYRQGSRSARALADALGGRVLKLSESTFKPRGGDVIINWGNTSFPNDTIDQSVIHATALNHIVAIKRASNKLRFFELMRDAGYDDIIPRFWSDREEIPDDAFPAVCRTVLAGHSGDGIVIANDRDSLVNAPLYVEYIKKQEEYRVHAGRVESSSSSSESSGEGTTIIAVQRKARRHDTPDEDVNWKVRSHHNGFNFVRGGFTPPTDVVEAARTALVATGLDFGAVDVIWNASKERAFVLEVNTAPGLEGQTVEDYANFFRSG